MTMVASVSGPCSDLAIPKSMIFGTGPSCPDPGDDDIGWLQVPVDDAFLVGVLDRRADLLKQSRDDPEIGRSLFIAVGGDGQPAGQFHDEVGTTRFGGSRIMNLGDIRDDPSGPGPAVRPRNGRSPPGCPCPA